MKETRKQSRTFWIAFAACLVVAVLRGGRDVPADRPAVRHHTAQHHAGNDKQTSQHCHQCNQRRATSLAGAGRSSSRRGIYVSVSAGRRRIAAAVRRCAAVECKVPLGSGVNLGLFRLGRVLHCIVMLNVPLIHKSYALPFIGNGRMRHDLPPPGGCLRKGRIRIPPSLTTPLL